MHIAVVPHSAPSKGGAYQYSLAVLNALASFPSDAAAELTLVVRSEGEIKYLGAYRSRWSPVRLPLFTRDRLMDMIETSIGDGWLRDTFKRSVHRLSPARLTDPGRIWGNGAVRRFLTCHNIDWILYTTPNVQSFEIGLPYVMPVFDLQHRLQPEFPEVSADGEWERREYLYRNGTRQATLILADSEVGKEHILNFYGGYGVTEDRVKVLPYVPPPYLVSDVSQQERTRVRNNYRLPKRYLFYPAQLWPHKNHLRLVQAIGQLKEDKGLEVHVVLCGAHTGAIRGQVMKDIMREVNRLGITNQIHYLGYVCNDAMSALYAEAVGLVMPTFFGPTNIPISEAWLLGSPVLTSDIQGVREQVGDAGLLIDPRSVEAIADGISRLWEDSTLRADLVKRGKERLSAYTEQNFCVRLAEIIAETNEMIGEQKNLYAMVSR